MAHELKILMLEDVEEEAGLIERALKRESLPFNRLRVDTPDEFVSALESFRPDVVLSDHALPQFNSIEALRICRERGVDIPFILVTGTVSEDFAVSCLKQGVDDYILKDNLSRLPAAILNALAQRKTETSRLEAELKLRDQNEELVRSNAALRKTNMELDNFVYSVSHNLRAPLTTVLGLVNLARMEARVSEPTGEKYLSMIEKSIFQLDKTIKQILDYSQNARTEIVISEIDFRKMFDGVVESLGYLPRFSNVEKRIQTGEDQRFFSDSHRLTIIFQNILSNGIQFQDDTKPVRFISTEIKVTDTDCQLEFTDNGTGIAEEHLPAIFKMFYRGNEKSTGAGLGLYLVKESVDALKGNITVESKVGEGTIVRIKLPNHVSNAAK